ncbi:hypothetical protein CCU04_018445 [Escherichia coli O103:H2]|nr:hypothetical protein CCU04_018445 [Escherichia coli O103:H2]
MLPSETMIWQPEFTDKTLSRKTGAVHSAMVAVLQMCRGFVVTRRITGKIHTLPSTTPCTAGIKTGRVRAFILCPS